MRVCVRICVEGCDRLCKAVLGCVEESVLKRVC